MALDEKESMLLDALLKDPDKRQAMIALLEDEHARDDLFYGDVNEEDVQGRLTFEEIKFLGSFSGSRSKVSDVLDRAFDVAEHTTPSFGMP